jgi:hypothetical protein
MPAARSIAMVAGEVSGDLLAAPIVRELRSRDPAISLVGIGGDRMSAEGFEAWGHVRELSLRGYVEVIRHLPRVFYLRTRLIRRLRKLAPSVFVGVDAPDFNLGLEQSCAPPVCARCSSSVPPYGPGGRSGSSRCGAQWTRCCWFFRSSSKFSTRPAFVQPMSVIRWPA